MSNHPMTAAPEMDPNLARELFERGATLVILDFPSGAEFGIDYCSWTAAEKFKGVKMIPPGVHFVYFSCAGKGGQAPRIGFMHDFKEGEVLVKKFDINIEDLSLEPVDSDEVAKITANLRDLDSNLGPYPYNSYRQWFSLTNHLRAELCNILQPMSGRLSAQCDLVTMESEAMLAMAKEHRDDAMDTSSSAISTEAPASIVDRAHPFRLRFTDSRGLPVMKVKPGNELRFTLIPKERVPKDCIDPVARAKHCMDASYQLETMLGKYNNTLDILGEMQFAFVLFLIGQVYAAFEQWKRLVKLMCGCSQALETHTDLYMQLLMCLHFQLKQCPSDFFVDIVSSNNFLTYTLSNLFANIEQNVNVDLVLKDKSAKFKASLQKQFKWDFEVEDDPIVVETKVENEWDDEELA